MCVKLLKKCFSFALLTLFVAGVSQTGLECHAKSEETSTGNLMLLASSVLCTIAAFTAK